jgi:glucosamine-6-phosphate deaminase
MDEVPKYAITMGIGTVMDAKELLLLANGDGKADAIQASVEGPITGMCPATVVQMHRKVYVLLDKLASSKLKGEYVDTWEAKIFA